MPVGSVLLFCNRKLFIYGEEKCPPEMRSAQAPFGAWAIMKKFIYACNVLPLQVLSCSLL